MDEVKKATTKQWFECRSCKTKMATMTVGKDQTFDIFGIGGSGKAFYCDNKECDKFGYLTIAGIQKEE